MSAIRDRIGEDLYLRLDAEADKEVALAMQMELVDKYGTEKYLCAFAIVSTIML